MSVYGLQLAVRGALIPAPSPHASFVSSAASAFVIYYKDWATQSAWVQSEVGSGVELLSATEEVWATPPLCTIGDNQVDKGTSPACELSLCVQLW